MANTRAEHMIENGQLLFRNFAGAPDKFNPQGGKRGFSVILEADEAAQLEAEGWPVKYLTPREDDEDQEQTPYISVKIKYDGPRPPKVTMMTSRARTVLDEASVEVLDWADIETADLIFTAYDWEMNGSTGRSAYLKSLYVTIEENALDAKYADIEEPTDDELAEIEAGIG